MIFFFFLTNVSFFLSFLSLFFLFSLLVLLPRTGTSPPSLDNADPAQCVGHVDRGLFTGKYSVRPRSLAALPCQTSAGGTPTRRPGRSPWPSCAPEL